jgi:hypothetical protein
MVSKKCNNQWVCFDKYVLLTNLFFFSILIFLYYYLREKQSNTEYNNSIMYTYKPSNYIPQINDLNNDFRNYVEDTYNHHNHTHLHNQSGNIFSDPFVPPLKPLWNQSPHLPNHSHLPSLNNVPINISTNYKNFPYRQIGILRRATPDDDDRERATILSLLGRPLHTSRNKWQYYTMTDKSNGIKLPIKIKKQGKGCGTNTISTLSSYGCNELNSGDLVTVDGYNNDFLVSIFDSDTLEYI